jgi:prepilin-type N-terminal cleavage/methylation domain-containing protein
MKWLPRMCPRLSGNRRGVSRGTVRAFTLLEVMLALALVAVMAAAAAPLLTDALTGSARDEATSATEDSVATLHQEAVRTGRVQKGLLTSSGLEPGRPLPQGWKLQVKRLTDSRFRNPREDETWEFNNAGICEPLAILLSGSGQSVELRFDPLTGEVLHE